MGYSIFLSVGEASGDLHGANLIKAIKQYEPDVAFCGMGSEKMIAAGMEAVIDASSQSVFGFTEVIKKFGQLKRDLDKLVDEIERRKPDCVVVIDYGGFNARLIKRVKQLGVRTVYYIPPKVWAWGNWRAKAIAKNCDLILCIFPFELDFWRTVGASAEFVGHPLIGLDDVSDAERAKEKYNVADDIIVALLPGSRRSEVGMLLPTMLQSTRLIRRELPSGKNVRFVLGAAPTISEEYLVEINGIEDIEIERDNVKGLMAIADLALVSSGTATLELALLETPMIIGYRMNPVSAFIVQSMIRVNWVGLPNLVSDDSIVCELLQKDFTVRNVVDEAVRILTDESYKGTMREKLRAVKEKLTIETNESDGRFAPDVAADKILKLIKE